MWTVPLAEPAAKGMLVVEPWNTEVVPNEPVEATISESRDKEKKRLPLSRARLVSSFLGGQVHTVLLGANASQSERKRERLVVPRIAG